MMMTSIKNIALKISDYLWLLSLAMVMCTVFAVDSEMKNGIVTGKYFWFYNSLLPLSFLSMLMAFFRIKKYSISTIDILITLFVIYLTANFYYHNGVAITKIHIMWALYAFYLNVRLFISVVPCAIKKLSAVIMIISIALSLMGLMQLYGIKTSYHNVFRITGTFFNPGPYSGYIAMSVALAFYTAMDTYVSGSSFFKNINLNKLYFLLSAGTIITAMLVLPSTMSRGAWIAVTGAGVVVLVQKYNIIDKLKAYFFKYKKRSIILFVASVVMISSVMYGIYAMKKESADGRAFLWKVSMLSIKEHPLSGVGLGGFAGEYGRSQMAYFQKNGVTESEAMTADCPQYAFNEYVQMTVDNGVVGLLLFLGILISSFVKTFKNRERRVVSASIIAFAIFAGVSYPMSILPILILFTFLLAVAGTSHFCNSGKVKAVLFSFIALGLSCFVWKLEYPMKKAYRSWQNLSYIPSSKYYDVSDSYEKWYSLLRQYHAFMFSYGQALSNAKDYKKSNDVLLEGIKISPDPMFYNILGNNYKEQGRFSDAENAYLSAYYMLPNRHYPLYLLMNLYSENGDVERAKIMARSILDKKPKVKSTAITQMQDKAKEVLEN